MGIKIDSDEKILFTWIEECKDLVPKFQNHIMFTHDLRHG